MKKLFVFLFCSLVLLGGTFTSAHAITAQAPGSTGTDYAELYSQLQALQQQINDLQWRNNVNMSIVSPSQVGDQAVVLNENGIITLIAPDGNTRKPGSSLFTRWTTSGFTGGEKTLSVYKMNTLVETISKSIPATANSYSWTIPSNFETGKYRVVLKDNATGVMSAVDEGLFTVDTTIVPPTPTPAPTPAQPTGKSLSLISPDGNSYTVGSGATIYTKWTSLGLSGNIGLSLYRGTTLIQKISGSVPVTQKTYSWKLPGNLGAGDYRVVIKDDITGTTSSGDEGLFTIIPSDPLPTPKITVLSPKGGEKYKIGNTVAIKWGAKNLPVSAGNKVSLSLLRYENGGPVGDVSINNEIANTGSYSFQIRDSIKAGLYKVRVSLPCGSTSIGTGVSDGWCGTYDESDSTFEIMANSYTGTPVKVTYPNGKEKLEIGKTYTIRWTARSFKTTADVQLGIIDTRYSSEAGDRSEKTIVNTKNTGSYKWTIPSNIGTMDFSDTSDPVYRIKLYVGNQETNDFDQSDNTFSIIDKRANNVKVSLSKNTPKSRDVKLGEQNAEFLRFDIANKGKEDITVTKIGGKIFNSSGMVGSLSNVKLFKSGDLITIARVEPFVIALSDASPNEKFEVNEISPTLEVSAGSVKTIVIKADVYNSPAIIGDKIFLDLEKLYFNIGENKFEINVNNVQGKKMTIVSDGVVIPSGAIRLKVSPSGFSPSQFTVKSGGSVTIALTGADSIHTHVFAFDDPSLSAVAIGVAPGETRNITFTAPTKAGEYTFRCDVPGHKEWGEKGKMVVTSSGTESSSVKVLSPNGGETINFSGKEFSVKFRPFTGAPHYINLSDESKDSAYDLVGLTGKGALTGMAGDEQMFSVSGDRILQQYAIIPGSKFKVEICSTGGCDKSDNYFTITSLATFLSAPTNLSAKVDGKNVVLSWNMVPNATAYGIYKYSGNDAATAPKENAKLFVSVGGIGVTGRVSYTDQPQCGVGNMYYIDAVNAGGRSLFSSGMQAGVSCALIGDVDGNGSVTCTDVDMIMNGFVGNITLTADQKIRADVDGNGTVQPYDASVLMQKNSLLCTTSEVPKYNATFLDTIKNQLDQLRQTLLDLR